MGILDHAYFSYFLLQNIDCGYSLEPPRCFYVLSKNKKNINIFSMKFFNFIQLKKSLYIVWASFRNVKIIMYFPSQSNLVIRSRSPCHHKEEDSSKYSNTTACDRQTKPRIQIKCFCWVKLFTNFCRIDQVADDRENT